MITDAEIQVRTSIQVFMADKNNPKPQGFGSGCIINYLDRKFFVTVSHVTNLDGLTAMLETNQPFDERGPILKPIGGICTFDLIQVKPDMNLNDFTEILEQGKTLDIAFAEIKDEIKLLQPEMDFGAFKVNASEKLEIYMDDATIPTTEERYGFYGKIRPEYEGIILKMTPTLKHSLTFHGEKGNFYLFLAPQTITDKTDYAGCSGAPILDSTGKIVALTSAVLRNSRVIYGFKIQECKRLLDIALQTGML
jgi:hypothetical protein